MANNCFEVFDEKNTKDYSIDEVIVTWFMSIPRTMTIEDAIMELKRFAKSPECKALGISDRVLCGALVESIDPAVEIERYLKRKEDEKEFVTRLQSAGLDITKLNDDDKEKISKLFAD